MDHLKAWDTEHRRGIWKGPYSLDFFDRHAAGVGHILDAGCGIGRYTIPLAMKGHDVTGIDVSMTASARLNDASGRRSLDIRVVTADICHLPFRNAAFDTVVCFGVLQHLLDRERVMAISEFRRVLKPGGTLVLEVFGRDDMRAGGEEVEPFTYLRDAGSVYHYFDVHELEEYLSDFELIDIKEERNTKLLGGKSYMRHMISAAAQATERDK